MSSLLWGPVVVALAAAPLPQGRGDPPSGALEPGGTITGIVRDGLSGRPVAGATVSLEELERSTVTDRGGFYEIAGMSAGPSHLVVQADGFESRTLHALVPARGRLRIHVYLRPRPVAIEPLLVQRARSPPAGDPAGRRERSLDMSEVRAHPGLAEPDPIAALVGAGADAAPEAPAGLIIAGAAPDQTAYRIDGVPVLNPYHAAGLFGAWNPDVVGRVSLEAPALPGGASGVGGTVAAETRTPGGALSGRGGLSTTQARAAFDGPLGVAGMGYVLGLRSGVVGRLAADEDPEYLRGATSDWLAKLEGPVVGGRLRVLGYGASNDIGAVVSVDASEAVGTDLPGHRFEWETSSVGIGWNHRRSTLDVDLLGWIAESGSEARWSGADAVTRLTAARRDLGIRATARADLLGGHSQLTVGFESINTRYRTEPEAGVGGLDLRSGRPVILVDARHERSLAERVTIRAGAGLGLTEGRLRADPRLGFELRVADPVRVTLDVSQSHQLSQSLRNVESIVGAVFPADLYIGGSTTGVPVVRGRRVALGAEVRPDASWRLSAEMFAARYRDIVVVAPLEGGPFAIHEFGVGEQHARGFGLEATRSARRLRLEGAWSWRDVERRVDDLRFAPTFLPGHRLDVGAVAFPSATWALRVGTTFIAARRTTPLVGSFEWESCNLLDRGCEFAGAPDNGGSIPGSARLPAYFRVDVGVRKHWHVHIGGLDATVEAFGTVTNVLGRRNLLTWMEDEAGGAAGVEMVPRSPLVVGIDWAF